MAFEKKTGIVKRSWKKALYVGGLAVALALAGGLVALAKVAYGRVRSAVGK